MQDHTQITDQPNTLHIAVSNASHHVNHFLQLNGDVNAPYIIVDASDLFPIPSGFLNTFQGHLCLQRKLPAELIVIVTEWLVVKRMFELLMVTYQICSRDVVFSSTLEDARKLILAHNLDGTNGNS